MPNVARRRMRYLLGGSGSVVLPTAGFLIQEHCCGVRMCHDGARCCCCCCCYCCLESSVHISFAPTLFSADFFFFFLNETVMRSRTRRRSLLVCAPRFLTFTSVPSSFTNILQAKQARDPFFKCIQKK